MKKSLAKITNIGELRTILLGTGLSGLASLTKMAISLVTVPLLLNYLGAEQFGLWYAMISLVLILTSVADGGVSNGVVTAVAKASAQNNPKAIKRILASSVFLLTCVSSFILLIVFLLSPHIPWGWLLNIDSAQMIESANSLFLAIATCMVLGWLASVVFKMRIGLQELPAVSIWNTLAFLLILPALMLSIQFNAEIGLLAVAVVGTPIFVRMLASVFYIFKHQQFIPSFKDIDLPSSMSLLGMGSVVFTVTLTQAIAVQSDQILVSNIAGLSEAAVYAVYGRLFMAASLLANFVFLAMWPMIARKTEDKQHLWVQKYFSLALFASTGFTLALVVVIALFNATILELWVGEAIPSSIVLASAFGLAAVLQTVTLACNTLLIAIDERRMVLFANIFMAVVNLPLSILLISEFGVVGAVMGTIIAYTVSIVAPFSVLIPRYFARVRRTQLPENAATT